MEVEYIGLGLSSTPIDLGILSEDNLQIERIALMFDPPNQKISFCFQDDSIKKTAILRQTATEIVAAIISKQSIDGD